MQMRIADTTGGQVRLDEVGDLQVTGEQVFREYFNNVRATMASFTKDDWSSTEDRAYIGANGNLNIAGCE